MERYGVYVTCAIRTLLVCAKTFGEKNLIVALHRSGSEWRESHQLVNTEASGSNPMISCALNNSKVLIGESDSKYMELFKVESGPKIVRFDRITLTEQYSRLSATTGSETLVALSYVHSNEVRVYRLLGTELKIQASAQVQNPRHVLWVADRLLIDEWHDESRSHSVYEMELSETQLVRKRELIPASEKVNVYSWCAVGDDLAIFEFVSKAISHYQLYLARD